MTNEERMEFVRELINDDPMCQDGFLVSDETVRAIVDRWEEDASDAFTRGGMEAVARGY